MELFAKIINGFHSLNTFAKKLHYRCSKDWVPNAALIKFAIEKSNKKMSKTKENVDQKWKR